jgi:hypothetical protein
MFYFVELGRLRHSVIQERQVLEMSVLSKYLMG